MKIPFNKTQTSFEAWHAIAGGTVIAVILAVVLSLAVSNYGDTPDEQKVAQNAVTKPDAVQSEPIAVVKEEPAATAKSEQAVSAPEPAAPEVRP